MRLKHQGSPEQIKEAEKLMTPEQKIASDQREAIFKAGREQRHQERTMGVEESEVTMNAEVDAAVERLKGGTHIITVTSGLSGRFLQGQVRVWAGVPVGFGGNHFDSCGNGNLLYSSYGNFAETFLCRLLKGRKYAEFTSINGSKIYMPTNF